MIKFNNIIRVTLLLLLINLEECDILIFGFKDLL